MPEALTPVVLIALFSVIFGAYVKINETRMGDVMGRLQACEGARDHLVDSNTRKDERILELEHEKVALTTELVRALVKVTDKVPFPDKGT